MMADSMMTWRARARVSGWMLDSRLVARLGASRIRRAAACVRHALALGADDDGFALEALSEEAAATHTHRVGAVHHRAGAVAAAALPFAGVGPRVDDGLDHGWSSATG